MDTVHVSLFFVQGTLWRSSVFITVGSGTTKNTFQPHVVMDVLIKDGTQQIIPGALVILTVAFLFSATPAGKSKRSYSQRLSKAFC